MKSKSPIIIHINRRRAEQNVEPIELGIEYTKRYREMLERNSNQLKQIFDLPMAESFDANAIALLIKQKGAEGIRIYYGVDKDKKVRLVLVPIDKNGKDIIAPLIKIRRSDKYSGTLTEQSNIMQDAEDDEDDYYTDQDEAEQKNEAEQLSAQDTQSLDAEDDAQVINSGQRCPDVCDLQSVLSKA